MKKFTKQLISVLAPILEIGFKLYNENRKEFREQQFNQIYFYGNVIGQLGILRYQFLTIISGVSIAVLGIVISSSEQGMNNYLWLSLILTFIVFISSSNAYLSHTRKEGEYIKLVQKEIPKLKPGKGLKTPEPKLFKYWPELLLCLLIMAVLLFAFGFIKTN